MILKKWGELNNAKLTELNVLNTNRIILKKTFHTHDFSVDIFLTHLVFMMTNISKISTIWL